MSDGSDHERRMYINDVLVRAEARTAEELRNAALDERERRLKADAEDARKALNRARARYDGLCDELRDLHLERQGRL